MPRNIERDGGGAHVDDVIGVPGAATLGSGSHVCALYSGPAERDRFLVPFLEEGLRAGNKCVCLVDQGEPADVLAKITSWPHSRGRDAVDQLEFDRASDVYLRAGRFSSERMLGFLVESVRSAAAGGFAHLRAAGEMSWVLPNNGDPYDYFAYESAVNEFVTQVSAVFMCLYDLQRFDTSMLVDVLKTHPQVLLDSAVLDNPHYLTPEAYLLERREVARTRTPHPRTPDRGRDLWLSLTDSERRVAGMVACGMTNRIIAERLTVSPHTIDAHLKHIYPKLDIHSRVELTVMAIRHR